MPQSPQQCLATMRQHAGILQLILGGSVRLQCFLVSCVRIQSAAQASMQKPAFLNSLYASQGVFLQVAAMLHSANGQSVSALVDSQFSECCVSWGRPLLFDVLE